MPTITATCPTCGQQFTAHSYPGRTLRTYCTQQCWLKKHNNPERNAEVARATIAQRADVLRDRGDGKSYRKVQGRHEHRAVVERMLGRPLGPDEIVHHINGDKRDNRSVNLTVVTRAQHAQIHFHGKEVRGVDIAAAD